MKQGRCPGCGHNRKLFPTVTEGKGKRKWQCRGCKSAATRKERQFRDEEEARAKKSA